MESAFLKQLSDFTDLKTRNDDCSSDRITPQLETNDLLLRPFKDLRDKLKQQQRESQSLREELKRVQVQVSQTQQLENSQRSIVMSLRQNISHLQTNNQELKLSLSLAKEQLKQKLELEEEISFLKQTLAQMSSRADALEQEKKQMLVIQGEETLQLQRQLERLSLKHQSEAAYVVQAEGEVGSLKEQLLRSQNQLKKLQIQHEQLLFNQQWSRDNFEKQTRQKEVQELNSQIASLTSRLKQEKQKRHELQQRVLELEHTTGLTHLQAETYQSQTGLLAQKVKTAERKTSKVREKLEQAKTEKIDWQQRCCKAVLVGEELISRVKRELNGDMVELAKTCEFRLNKLKSKDPRENRPKSHTQTLKDTLPRKSKSLLKHHQKENCLPPTTSLQPTEETPKNVAGEEPVGGAQLGSGAGEGGGCELQAKIRRERRQMQNKLKEKLLFRKLQVSGSPLKPSLRQNYLQLIFNS